jgi:nitroimidazol reductase NimA-like FMN-containing flavoprotein (pyridoxamine 5'-phosphate oxidase superfamily)
MSDDSAGAVHRSPANPDLPDDPVWDPDVEVLDEAECLRLIPAGGIGRLAYSGTFGPVVIPVGYKLSDSSIVFRTVLGSPTDEDLRTGIQGANYKVSFEVEDLDQEARTGWFVLIQGPVRHVDSDDDRAAILAPLSRSSDRHTRDHFMIITPSVVSGRILRRAGALAPQGARLRADAQFSVCMHAGRAFAARWQAQRSIGLIGGRVAKSGYLWHSGQTTALAVAGVRLGGGQWSAPIFGAYLRRYTNPFRP